MPKILTFIILFLLSVNAYSSDQKNFIQRKGNKLFLKGKEKKLRGVCFGNNVWEGPWEVFKEVPVDHHNEKDYQRIKSWGINTVRFYLNYKTFESDNNPFKYKRAGWNWMDKNIRWAKKNNIYLILAFIVPQGGLKSLGSKGIWSSKKNEKRFIALWKAIASRYKNEPVIAGYDLLDHPEVPRSINQWKQLSNKIIHAIRSVDKNHLIFLSGILGFENRPKTHYRIQNLFLVKDKNVAYTFHYYHPFEYTLQKAPWTSYGDYGKYPNNSKKINKTYLAYKLKPYIRFAKRNNVPLICSDFGADNYCYDEHKGGEKWTADVMDLFIKNNINFTYHCYHERWFGIFANKKTELPDPQKLRVNVVNIFKKKIKIKFYKLKGPLSIVYPYQNMDILLSD